MTQSTILFYSSKSVAKYVQENFTMSECTDESSDEDYADFQTETDSDISPPSSPSSSSSSEEEEEEIAPKRGGVRTRGGAAKRPRPYKRLVLRYISSQSLDIHWYTWTFG